MKKTLFVLIVVFIATISFVPVFGQQIHNVDSQRPLYFTDGDTGQQYYRLRGNATMSWYEKTRDGFFNAKVIVLDSPVRLSYEINLVAVSNCTNDMLEGIFDIKRNNILVASGIVGKLYGIDSPVGVYYKFYGGTSQTNDHTWHFSAYITDRLDY